MPKQEGRQESAMRVFLLALLCLLPVSAGCWEGPHAAAPAVSVEPFQTIARQDISKIDLAQALAKLTTPVSEPAQYWTGMANDSAYPDFHRRGAVVQLFRRHVKAGMQLSAVARLLDHPTWLRPGDIAVVDIVGGYIPVAYDLNGTVFVLSVLPEPDGSCGAAIYLRVRGRIGVRDLRDLVSEAGGTRAAKARVAEVACFEP
jgi:hypothetical protein